MTESNPISLDHFKNRKKYQKIYSELLLIVKIYDLAITALKYFSKYVIVMETVSTLASNKVLLEIYLAKYKKMLNLETNEKQN